ncbi:hypothetical protein CYMTET_8912, partial [Cymbomonas tetramitiformis]
GCATCENRVFTSDLTDCLDAGLDHVGEDEDEDEDSCGTASSNSDSDESSSSSSSSDSSDTESGIRSKMGRVNKGHRYQKKSRLQRSSAQSGAHPLMKYPEAALISLTPKLQRALRQDLVRDDDDLRLNNLINTLDGSRKDTPKDMLSKAAAVSVPTKGAPASKPGRVASARASATQSAAKPAVGASRDKGSRRFTHW